MASIKRRPISPHKIKQYVHVRMEAPGSDVGAFFEVAVPPVQAIRLLYFPLDFKGYVSQPALAAAP